MVGGMRVVMELVLAQSAGSHTCSYTENQGHLAATARRPQHVARKGYAGYVLAIQYDVSYHIRFIACFIAPLAPCIDST